MIALFFTVIFLVFMECLLSADNAIVLALLIKPLQGEWRRKALTYGIWGAIGFRALALIFLTQLMHLTWFKLLGAGYLIYVSLRGFYKTQDDVIQDPVAASWSFWKIVLAVELTDIMFSFDSMLASVSISQSYVIVFLGGALGIISMRFATQIFSKLLDLFPYLEKIAYILILSTGLRLLFQTLLPDTEFNSSLINFGFWTAIIGSNVVGFLLRPKTGFRSAS